MSPSIPRIPAAPYSAVPSLPTIDSGEPAHIIESAYDKVGLMRVDPALRGVVTALAVAGVLFVLKPSFAFHENGWPKSYEETYVPWWSIVLTAYAASALLI